MDLNDLFDALGRYHPVSSALRGALEKECVVLSLPKNRILLDAPGVSTHAYYLRTGFAMAYYFMNGRRMTEEFWKPGQFIIAFQSFFGQTPSNESIQLMRNSDVVCISHNSVTELLDRYPEAQRICQALMVHHYSDLRLRLREMRQYSASVRLERLLALYPDLEQNVPQDAIATFLGVTAQSLARIKRFRR